MRVGVTQVCSPARLVEDLVGLLDVYHRPMGTNVVFLVIAIMLVVGVVFALAWWQMADVLFPGTARKTGQRIFGGRKDQSPPPGATVIKGFDSQEPPSGSAR